MSNFEIQKQNQQGVLLESALSYNDIIKYLDNHWTPSMHGAIQKIDSLLGFIAPTLPSIIITGTTGKSTTIYYLSKLLQAEGLKVGIATCPHFNFYNERIAINQKIISNDIFAKLANTIITIIQTHNIPASSKDILTAISLLYFKQEQADIIILEQENIFEHDPVTISTPSILGITRIVLSDKNLTTKAINTILKSISEKTLVASADQNKSTLHTIAQKTKELGGSWIMPIRKIAPLPYPYEQLHGRCAALAERIAETYINQITNNTQSPHETSLLTLIKKQRSKPSLISKQYASYPQKTTEHFWQTIDTDVPNRFQYIEQKNGSLILDAATNIDALKNLLLGIRLLNYKTPFKSISFLLGCYEQQFCEQEFIKIFRYFLKKIPGQIALYPISNHIGEQVGTSCNIDHLSIAAQNAKIKINSYKNFKNAYEALIKQQHDQLDLLVISGSQAIISEFLKYKSKPKP